CWAIARWVAATSSAREVNGFCTETTFKPLACRSGTTLFHSEPSTNAPCTSTTVVSCGAAEAKVGIAKPDSIVIVSSNVLRLGTVTRIIYSFQEFVVYLLEESDWETDRPVSVERPIHGHCRRHTSYDDRSDRDEELAPHDGREFGPSSLRCREGAGIRLRPQ